MTSNHPEGSSAPVQRAVFHKVAENLYRLAATGGYYALVKRAGKQFRRSLKTRDRKLAERRLREIREQIGNLSLSEDGNLDFGALGERWLGSVRHTIKERSALRRAGCIKNLARFFKRKAVRSITKVDCERWVTERGPSIAASTFAHELSTMKTVFEYAIEHGLILSNPAGHVKRRRIPQAKVNVPTREQFQRLVATIRASDGRPDSQNKAKAGADLVELLAYSGMRVGEATALKWRDLDFDNGVVTVTGGAEGTKNHEDRVLPMTEALRTLLIRLSGEAEPSPHDLVSPISDAKTTMRKTCSKLGIPRVTHHDLRHFFATTAIESGVDVPTVSRWLGHKDGGALAMRVYGHLRAEHSREQIRRVTFGPVVNVVPLALGSER